MSCSDGFAAMQEAIPEEGAIDNFGGPGPPYGLVQGGFVSRHPPVYSQSLWHQYSTVQYTHFNHGGQLSRAVEGGRSGGGAGGPA
eukprot:5797038-Pyramimonas_sp.AAC.1